MFLDSFTDELCKLAGSDIPEGIWGKPMPTTRMKLDLINGQERAYKPIGRQGPKTSVPREKRRAPSGAVSASARIDNEVVVDNRRARHMGMPKGPSGNPPSGTRWLNKHLGRKTSWPDYKKQKKHSINSVRSKIRERARVNVAATPKG